MRRFWVEEKDIANNEVTFVGDSYKHLVRVSRKDVGDQVEVLFGGDKAYVVELTSVNNKSATAKILSERPLPQLPKPHIELAFCLPKPNVFEAVLEKSVELGVAKVHPLFNEFSFFKNKKDLKDSKWTRWEKIVTSATTQTSRGDIMRLGQPMPLLDFAENINPKAGVLGLFFYEGESATPVKSYLRQLDLSQYDRIIVFVGSEGGFSPQEVKALNELGFQSITVGPQILRAETACVAIMSVIKYEAEQMGESNE